MINEKTVEQETLLKLKQKFDEFTYMFIEKQIWHKEHKKNYMHPYATIALGYKGRNVCFKLIKCENQFNRNREANLCLKYLIKDENDWYDILTFRDFGLMMEINKKVIKHLNWYIKKYQLN